MNLKRLIPTTFLFLTVILNAQTDFRAGYIIGNIGDTLYGEIDYRGDFWMSQICRFKADDNSIRAYSPQDIKAFRFIDSKYFISQEINNNKVFLEFLISGKVNILLPYLWVAN